MRKRKELFLFMTMLIVPPAFPLIVSALSAYVLSDRPQFVGVVNYIRMFSNDKLFGKTLFNTVFGPAIFSFLIVAVFAVIVYLVRKKIKVSRKVFYIGGVFVGAITTLAYVACINAAFLRAPGKLNAVQTIVSHIGNYSPNVFNVISISTVSLSLYIGILTAFVFWIMELIGDIVKSLVRKKDMK